MTEQTFTPPASAGSERGATWPGMLLLIVLVTVMAALAGVLAQPDLIFPEGAALTYGIAVRHNADWSSSRWRIVVLPPLCAVIGHLLAGVQEPRWMLEIAGVTAGLLLLWAFDCRLAPSLSAAALPIVFGVRSWAYPAAVVIVCLTIVAWERRHHAAPTSAARHPAWSLANTARGWTTVCGWILIAGPVLMLPAAAVAPPLFVSALEWLNHEDQTLERGARRYALLVGSGALGALASMLAPAEWVAAPVALMLALALMQVLGCWHPPALAVSLIPGIVTGTGFGPFTLGIAVGAGVLYLAASAGWLSERPFPRGCGLARSQRPRDPDAATPMRPD